MAFVPSAHFEQHQLRGPGVLGEVVGPDRVQERATVGRRLRIADASELPQQLGTHPLLGWEHPDGNGRGQGDGEAFDHLTVTGTATLDGQLDLEADTECEPAPGDEFPIITADNVVGEFAQVAGLENVEIVYTETTVTVVVTGGCPADLDGNGAVDFGDVLLILAAWGNKGGPEDLDGNGIVDFGDLLIVLAAWGPCE